MQEFIDILSSMVESDFELKRLAEELFQSLRNAVEDGEQVSTIVVGVKKLFESAVFIQACVETYMEDPHLLIELEPNSNAEGKERIEALKKDPLFQCILEVTQTAAIIRGVLTLVFGYWSDKDCYHKVSEVITRELQKIHKPNNEPPVEMVFDDIPNIDVSSDIEIERKMSNFERLLSPVFLGVIPKRITRLGVVWFGKSLRLRCLDFAY